MQNLFDTVISSSDLSLDRVLNAGLPVALIFYERELPTHLRQGLDELARRYAGRALIVCLARNDAPQAASRFKVGQFPALVTVRDGRVVTTLEGLNLSDLGAHIAYLLGEGPQPAPRGNTSSATSKRETSTGPISVNESNFDREVLHSDRPVMVDFWAPWCAPCRMVAPTLEKLAREQSNLKIAKLNVDENPNLAGKYRSMSIPTMIIFHHGQEVDRWVGAMPENMLRGRVARWLQGS